MSKKKFALKASVVAMAAVLPGLASAAISMSDSIADARTYASELVTNGTTVISDTNLNALVNVGFGVSNGQTRFIRFDLSNGKFGGTVAGSHVDAGVSTAGTSYTPAVAVSAGGSTSDTYVIFQVTADANYASSDVFSFGLGTAGGVKVTDKASSVSLTYGLFETGVAAVNNTTSDRLATATETIASFGTGLKFALTTGTQTASVSTLYKSFTGSSANGPVEIGEVNYTTNANVYVANGSAVALSDLVSTANVVVAGDFTAAGSVHLTTGGTCSATTTVAGTLNSAKTQATLAVDATAQTTGAICYTVTGTTVLPVQTVTAALDVTSGAGADVSAGTLGTIAHDGTVLKAPYMAGASGQTTFVQLANMGTTTATYTTRCFGGSSTTSTGTDASGTVAVGGVKKVYMNNVGCPTSSSAVEFTLAVPSGNVVGTLVRQSTTTGDSAMDSLTGNE